MKLPDKFVNQIVCGNNVDVLAGLPDGCIDLTVTSPPYDNLRTYKGFQFDFEGLAKQLWRVTAEGGVVVWVVGDATVQGSETGTSFRQALRFMDLGFRLHDTMIYAKRFFVPLTHNRYEQKFEYMFVFSNGKPKTFNPIYEPCKTAGHVQNYTSSKETSQSMRRKSEVRHILPTKIRPNFWTISPAGTKYLHPAIFPAELAHDHIVSWSNPGDIVLDPFSGSGTTVEQAKETGINYLGIDVSAEYCKIARDRVNFYADVATQAEELKSTDFEELLA